MRGGEDGASTSGALPTLAVFDLDACFWDEEMYTLREVVDPGKNVRGSLGDDVGEGVVAAVSGRTRIRINPGALHALQNYYRGKYPGMRLAAASSADTPLAVRIGRSALAQLEIFPGVTAREVFAIGWPEGFEANLQIGRTPPLSANKAATHFPILRRETGVPFDEMVFFDDDPANIRDVAPLGVVCQLTPDGVTAAAWEAALGAYAKARP